MTCGSVRAAAPNSGGKANTAPKPTTTARMWIASTTCGKVMVASGH